MTRSKPDKQALLAALAAHVLETGLNTASLRPMAASAGTSDRMLIYHFGSKENLIGSLLEYIAAKMAAELDTLLPPEPLDSEATLVVRVVESMRSDRFTPYARVWHDIVSAAAQGQLAHREAGNAIVRTYLDWIALRHPNGEAGAPFALTLIDGILVMDAVGQKNVADAALARLRSADAHWVDALQRAEK